VTNIVFCPRSPQSCSSQAHIFSYYLSDLSEATNLLLQGGIQVFFLYRTAVDGVDMFAPAPHVDMFVLNCHLRSNGSQMGDIFQLTDIREVVELVPQFGSKVDNQLNCNNLLDIPDTFYLNNFTGKENFHAILSYQ
jgi:hypothetical protein